MNELITEDVDELYFSLIFKNILQELQRIPEIVRFISSNIDNNDFSPMMIPRTSSYVFIPCTTY